MWGRQSCRQAGFPASFLEISRRRTEGSSSQHAEQDDEKVCRTSILAGRGPAPPLQINGMHAPVAQGHALRKTFSASFEACATHRGRSGARFSVPSAASAAGRRLQPPGISYPEDNPLMAESRITARTQDFAAWYQDVVLQ